MWRSRSLEEWERKKSYLIRSLFEDTPILSPILERQEPASLSLSPSLSTFINRAESSLPELIIEVEPKKPNLHDEPEELYDELAKEMRRMYRKDFLGIQLSTSSSESSRSETIIGGKIYDNIMSDETDSDNALIVKYKCQIDYDAAEHQKDNDIDFSTQTDVSTTKGSSESIHVASESVIVQVDVHSQEYETQENLAYEQQGITEGNQYRQSGVDSINVSKTTNVIESIEGEDDNTDKEERSDSESFAKDTNASNYDSSVNSSNDSPEIMRQRQPFMSLETSHHRPVSESDSTVSKIIHLSMEVDSKEFSEDVLPSDQEIEIAEGSGNKSYLFVTSTPTRKRTSPRFSTKRGYKRRLVSYSSSSLSASAANAALQTSFSDCETDLCNFWNSFFIGMPTVYNVCSCNDHVCTI